MGADSRPPAVSILSRLDGEPVGSGVLLPGQHVLTCAHVVNCAVGCEMLAVQHPGPVSLQIRVYGPDITHMCQAELTAWIAPRPGDGGLGAYEWNGDLAVLRLDSPLPHGIQPPRWRPMAEKQLVRAWHGGAERGSFADVEVTECNGRFGYVDALRDKLAVDRGYSGGPLWSGHERAVVGLVTARLNTDGALRRAWGIPWQRIRDELAGAGLAALTAQPDDDVRGDPFYAELVALLDRRLPHPEDWARCGRAVAWECGLEYSGDGDPSAEEFAHLILTHERALPTLVGALRNVAPRLADELLLTGRGIRFPRLLTPREFDLLVRCLEVLDAASTARVAAALRASLPLAVVPEPLVSQASRGEGIGDLVGYLERLPGPPASSFGHPGEAAPVPGLVRAVEFLAVCCPSEQRGALRQWSERVAARLAIHRSALEDRRRDAEEWAARQERTAAPRLLVELSSCGTADGAACYRLRLWCDDADGPRRVSAEDDRPRTAQEAAREIFDALAPLHPREPDGPLPVIELLVDRDALELPADEWRDAGLGGLLTRVLGAEYPLVVDCPELRELGGRRSEAEWRQRWKRLDEGGVLRVTRPGADQNEVYGVLMEQRHIAQVVVDVPAATRSAIVQTCLAVGVPVVLWDRGGTCDSPAVRYAAGVPVRGLPEAVRMYRAKTLQRPDEFAGRPVLTWADADRPDPRPQLELADPTESP
ncbi:trypsin-like peptidase domain-containing protein [Streptomyces cynarae]|uniref:Trypsin-like peptidase domain-containing protein n=1 Tax=Streptomyces cynarae TaxID=2981134 RepID=A0ABY6DUQ8_9ACTN|nr:trypsin-like peptidase domain-containing protein [Streptomyces cynarae]UXY17468.1 trypsin-like peptidase domain-containing protein [Streptomyces cynarae]